MILHLLQKNKPKDNTYYCIDSINNNIYVLESLDDKSIINYKGKIDAREGDILLYKDNTFIKDDKMKKNREDYLREKMNKLKRRDNMYLVFVRHGESVWNKENRFTGWTDVELSEKGIDEAINAGMMLATTHIQFSVAYTSVLKRANDTLKYIMDYVNVPLVIKDYRLNERHYGALQGLNKDEMRAKYGEEQVHIWRRSYDVRPPELDPKDERNPKYDSKYAGIDNLPLCESLKDTLERAKEVYDNDIKKHLSNHENVLVVAHGNSIRALIKDLESISDDDITSLEIPTGRPIIYELDDNLNVLSKTEL